MKKNRGITLIALVITIIILLILAGVTIGTLRNSNIFGNAEKAANKYNREAERENALISGIDDYINKYIEGTSIDLSSGNITASSPSWDATSHTASVTLSTETGMQIQWQKGGIDGTWKTSEAGKSSVIVTGLQHGDNLYARLYDGTNAGDEAYVKIKDGTLPTTATIVLGATTANTEENVTAKVTHNDGQSGPKIQECKWVYNTTSGNIGTEASSYTGGTFSSNGQTINLKATTSGTYYLHVLTVDMAGNAFETVYTQSVTISQLATAITVSPGTLTIDVGKTSNTLQITFNPTNTTDKSITWSSSNTGIAKVVNGKVTGVSEGTAIITATSSNGKTSKCTVTVEKAGITPADIANSSDKSKYYGAIVTGYNCENSAGVNAWKIFYADEKNIYLIADDYISYKYVPNGRGGTPLDRDSRTDYKFYLTNIISDYNDSMISDYNGSTDITDSRIKALNNDYFIKGYTSSNDNMKAVAYMLDTNMWSGFRNTTYADYAIGGPTIEMLMKSYSQKYNVDYKAQASNSTGYMISKDGGENFETHYTEMLDVNDSLYVAEYTGTVDAMWVASPAEISKDAVIYIDCDGTVSVSNVNAFGFRPLVCLNSSVQLKENVDGSYAIK